MLDVFLQGGGLNIGSSFWDLCVSPSIGTFEEAVSLKLHHFVKKVLEILFERYCEAQCSYYSSYNRYTNWLASEVLLRVSIGRRYPVIGPHSETGHFLRMIIGLLSGAKIAACPISRVGKSVLGWYRARKYSGREVGRCRW